MKEYWYLYFRTKLFMKHIAEKQASRWIHIIGIRKWAFNLCFKNYHWSILSVRKYFLPTNLLFVHADAGIGKINDKTDNSSSTRFSADMGGGVKLGLFEMGVAFDGFVRDGGFASWFGFKAGWRFGL